ncbi:hypothetical protein E2C01_020892 [Portunus trituberculatus]|uniref:Uncharacterized protein n=1 Tax=Portunus trituberculatus TaxID=210409 RepID=A0A5B7E3A1_PORTR|nr:hypothetical protein [Portunus trituberculatus]
MKKRNAYSTLVRDDNDVSCSNFTCYFIKSTRERMGLSEPKSFCYLFSFAWASWYSGPKLISHHGSEPALGHVCLDFRNSV